MARKKSSNVTTAEIRKLIKSKNIIIGTQRTIKNLKLGRIDKVFISSNCPLKVKNSITYYAKLSKAEPVTLQYPNDELGEICRKPFSISVLSVLKGGS